ncbi:MAG: hypothetical protein KAT15_28930, partial [Bacteroidales bacterium]|nr:hypothetical protein [Bacteroidales bacterium]
EMKKIRGYVYSVTIPSGILAPGILEYCIAVAENGSVKTYPGVKEGEPGNWEGKSENWDFVPGPLWESYHVPSTAPLSLLDVKSDRDMLNFTRIFRSIPFTRKFVPGSQPGKLALQMNIPDFSDHEEYQFPLDVSFDHFIGDKIKYRGGHIKNAVKIKVVARATSEFTDKMILSLIDKDGFAWGAEIPVSLNWQEIEVALSNLQPGKAAMLPQDWPGVNSYWYPNPEDNNTEGSFQLENIEKVQISLRKELYPDSEDESHGIEIERVILSF